MTQRLLWFCACALVLCAAPTASGQESRAVGVTMGYPSSVGLMWHVAERIAVRPELSFATTKTDVDSNSSSSVTKGSGSSIGVGISGLFYVGKWDALRAYVAPRFVYSRSSTRVEHSTQMRSFSPPSTPFIGIPTVPPGFIEAIPTVTTTVVTTADVTNSSKSAMGLFGASYALHKHFSIFGEAGFGYSTSSFASAPRPDSSINISSILPPSRTWSTRTGVGATLYF